MTVVANVLSSNQEKCFPFVAREKTFKNELNFIDYLI